MNMETAVVKRKRGRPFKPCYKLHPDNPLGATAAEILDMASAEAASYLRAVANGDERKPDWTRINTAQFIVKEHLARLRNEGLVDEAGNRIVSYKVLVLMAEQRALPQAGPTDSIGQASDDHSDRPWTWTIASAAIRY
jgi:hypothetical protein